MTARPYDSGIPYGKSYSRCESAKSAHGRPTCARALMAVTWISTTRPAVRALEVAGEIAEERSVPGREQERGALPESLSSRCSRIQRPKPSRPLTVVDDAGRETGEGRVLFKGWDGIWLQPCSTPAPCQCVTVTLALAGLYPSRAPKR
jgi:hypothetical protein